DCQHRLMVHLRVVEAVQQVNGAGARGGEADSEIAGEFGVAARHKGGHLFVPHLNEFELVARPVECPDQTVDPVARKAKDALDPPGRQALPEEIADRASHLTTSLYACSPGPCTKPDWRSRASLGVATSIPKQRRV